MGEKAAMKFGQKWTRKRQTNIKLVEWMENGHLHHLDLTDKLEVLEKSVKHFHKLLFKALGGDGPQKNGEESEAVKAQKRKMEAEMARKSQSLIRHQKKVVKLKKDREGLRDTLNSRTVSVF